MIVMLGCISCEWQFLSDDEGAVVVDRYDRIQSLYLTTGDFSALQQMNTVYPMQTRTLIEDVLRIGKVNDQQINTKFLRFYQDTTLQTLIAEAEQQYANMEDISETTFTAWRPLRSMPRSARWIRASSWVMVPSVSVWISIWVRTIRFIRNGNMVIRSISCR